MDSSPTVPVPHECATASGSHRSPAEVLHSIADPRVVLQEICPAELSLDWDLGAHYWRTVGVQPFVRNEVPFLINNDGLLSRLAAELLHTNCQEAGSSERPIVVVEFGAGIGLFARFMLDAIRTLSERYSASDYDRLTYFVTDGSARTVADWVERGLFAEHGPRVVPAVADLQTPNQLRLLDGKLIDLPPARAIFCNYVLDVLPCAVVRRRGEIIEELCVRTLLPADPLQLAEHTTLRAETLVELARSADPALRSQLVELMPLFEYETSFCPVTRPIAHLDAALAERADSESVVLNHGALRAIEALCPRLDPHGFLLINDYGPISPEEQVSYGVCQRFGATSAIGLNFPLLEKFAKAHSLRITAPPGDETRGIHTRLVSRQPLPATEDFLVERFSAAALAAIEEPARLARAAVGVGNFGEALDQYREALNRQPRNWRLLGEIAEFVLFHVRDAAAALELAKSALDCNPGLSPWLWNVLGDALYTLEKHGEAHDAYVQALSIDPKDPRTLLNLSYTLLLRADHQGALEAIARGLANDAAGSYRERLLEKQQQLLAALMAAAQHDRDRAALRVARFQVARQGEKTAT